MPLKRKREESQEPESEFERQSGPSKRTLSPSPEPERSSREPSPSPSPSALRHLPHNPLTQENLSRIGPALIDGDIDEDSDMASSQVTNVVERLESLRDYDIFVNHGARDGVRRPPELEELIRKILDTPRPTNTPPSPNAKLALVAWQQARYANEPSEKYLMCEKLLGLQVEVNTGIAVASDQNFARKCIPKPTRHTTGSELAEAMRGLKLPENPQPDTIYGYTRVLFPGSLFNTQEGQVLRRNDLRIFTSVCPPMFFPFLSAQWKSSNGSGHPVAELQGARDGTAIVFALYTFLLICGMCPSAADCAHFSVTIDSDSAYLWVHWRHQGPAGEPTWEMDRLGGFFLWEEEDLARFRTIVRNIYSHALGPRLQLIKQACKKASSTPSDITTPNKKSSTSSGFKVPTNSSTEAESVPTKLTTPDKSKSITPRKTRGSSSKLPAPAQPTFDSPQKSSPEGQPKPKKPKKGAVPQ